MELTAKQLYVLCVIRKGKLVKAKNLSAFSTSLLDLEVASKWRDFYARTGDFLTLATKSPDLSWWLTSKTNYFKNLSYEGKFEIKTELTEIEESVMALIV